MVNLNEPAKIPFSGLFLPPANEVWGKVIFSVACVKNSVHRGGGFLGRYPPSGTVHAGRYGQQAGGTHPTGMHSCLKDILSCGNYRILLFSFSYEHLETCVKQVVSLLCSKDSEAVAKVDLLFFSVLSRIQFNLK